MRQFRRGLSLAQAPLTNATLEIVQALPDHAKEGRIVLDIATGRVFVLISDSWKGLGISGPASLTAATTNAEAEAGHTHAVSGFVLPDSMTYGIVKRMTTSSGTETAVWCRIARFTMASRFSNCNACMQITGTPSTTGLPYAAKLYLTVLQQSAMPAAPFGRLVISDAIGLGTANVKAIITATDPASIVEVWIEAVHTYKSFDMRLLHYMGPGTADYTLSAWTAAASLPAGDELTVVASS